MGQMRLYELGVKSKRWSVARRSMADLEKLACTD